MIAQFVLTSSEAKKFISLGLARHPLVQEAVEDSMVVIHPSSSTYFLVEALTGYVPGTKVWVAGVIVPRGACVEANTRPTRREGEALTTSLKDPGMFPYSWVIKKGSLYTGIKLDDILKEMDEKSVYVKGVNAVDTAKNAGVLRASMAEGTIGKVLKVSEKNKFKIICPVGTEKLVWGSLAEKDGFSSKKKDYAMGCSVNLFTLKPLVINETEAASLLGEVNAEVIASGGLAGAEGGVTLLVEGEKEEVRKVIQAAELSKGARLPEVLLAPCSDCGVPTCEFKGWEEV